MKPRNHVAGLRWNGNLRSWKKNPKKYRCESLYFYYLCSVLTPFLFLFLFFFLDARSRKDKSVAPLFSFLFHSEENRKPAPHLTPSQTQPTNPPSKNFLKVNGPLARATDYVIFFSLSFSQRRRPFWTNSKVEPPQSNDEDKLERLKNRKR